MSVQTLEKTDNRFTPQQGFPERKNRSDSKTPTRKRSTLEFEAYLRLWADEITREQKKLRKLTEMSVTLHRRFRGLTLSDLCGRYGIRIETNGRWLDYDANLDGEIHPINIIQPAIRANTNACLQSNAAVNVESASASAKNKKIAERWQKVSNYFERFGWSEDERAFLFDAIQKDGTVLIRTYSEDADACKMASVNESAKFVAAYKCAHCGKQGRREVEKNNGDKMPEGSEEVSCPNCGAQAKGIIKRLPSYELDEKESSSKTVHHKIIPFYNFCIDAFGARDRDIKSAKWLQIHEAKDRSEIEAAYPQFVFAAPNEWSYQLQCQYALASSDFSILNGRYSGGSGRMEFDRFESRDIYLHESAFCNYVCPKDYEFVNGKGEKTFEIKAGETIDEAQKRFSKKDAEGFKFTWIDDRLRDIASPDDETLNFRNCFAAAHWVRDSSGFYSSPNISVVTIQDDITLLNTMNHNIIARNAVNQVYYDSLVFEESDFSQEYVGTKNAALLPDRDMSKGITTLPVPTPSPYLQQQLQFLWGIKDTVTQVQPALRGEQQRGETYGAQRQQLEQSYGGLTAALKSFAGAKVRTTRHKFEIVKNCWTLEQFQKVAAVTDEVWNDDDVSEMCEINFDSDLIVDYTQGSEMPESNLSREMKFSAGLNQVIQLVAAGVPIDPDKMQKILEKIDDIADFDFDLTGLEVDETISQKRLKELSEICASFGNISFEQIDQAKNEQAGVDEQGQPVTSLDLIVEQIFNESKIRFSRYENLEQQGKYYTENLRNEIGSDKPNYLLIEVLQVVLGMIEQAISAVKQEAQANDPQYQAQQQQLAEQQQQLEAAKQSDAEQQQRETDDKMKVDAAQHEADLEKMNFKHAASMIAQKQSAENHPKEKKK